MLMLLVSSGGEGGFNPLDLAAGGNTLWTWVIFLIAIPFIWGTVMGPVTRALEERDAKAERAIVAAEKASREAEEARAKLEVTLAEAQSEAAKVVAEARSRAEARGHEIVESAKAEAAGLVEGARKAIRAEQDKAISAIREEVVDLAMNAASRVLERQVGSEDDRRLVDQLVTEAGKN
jgi:F-type H+-transporting ATPase subunit b